MGVKYLVILFLILAACEPSLQTVPTSDYQPTVDTAPAADLCKNVNCTNGQTCKDGKCICPEDKKLCDNKCIAKEKCCTDNDCETGICLNSTCITPKECGIGMEFKDGECTCTKDKRYCEEQKKCIDKNRCCIHAECDSFERCEPTNYKTSLCIKIEEKKLCRMFIDIAKEEYYTVKDKEFKVKPTNWWNDGLTFLINNQSVRLKPYQNITFEEATIFQENITITGGYCKEDTED